MIPLHPESCPGDPRTLRWRVAWAGPSPLPAGRVYDAPGDLGRWVADGTLEQVAVEEGGDLLVTCPRAEDWSRLGAAVRTTLHAAVESPSAWVVRADQAWADMSPSDTSLPEVSPDAPVDCAAEPTAGGHHDALLRTIVEDVVDGDAGAYVRSHGGSVSIVSIHDGAVELRLSGTCSHCPAAGATLHHRLEREIRARYPRLRSLTAAEIPGPLARVLGRAGAALKR